MEAAKQRVYLVMTAFFFLREKDAVISLTKTDLKNLLRGTAGSDNDT